MRRHSVYEFVCECGAQIACEEPQTRCPKCDRLIRIVWREEEPNEPRD